MRKEVHSSSAEAWKTQIERKLLPSARNQDTCSFSIKLALRASWSDQSKIPSTPLKSCNKLRGTSGARPKNSWRISWSSTTCGTPNLAVKKTLVNLIQPKIIRVHPRLFHLIVFHPRLISKTEGKPRHPQARRFSVSHWELLVVKAIIENHAKSGV